MQKTDPKEKPLLIRTPLHISYKHFSDFSYRVNNVTVTSTGTNKGAARRFQKTKKWRYLNSSYISCVRTFSVLTGVLALLRPPVSGGRLCGALSRVAAALWTQGKYCRRCFRVIPGGCAAGACEPQSRVCTKSQPGKKAKIDLYVGGDRMSRS